MNNNKEEEEKTTPTTNNDEVPRKEEHTTSDAEDGENAAAVRPEIVEGRGSLEDGRERPEGGTGRQRRARVEAGRDREWLAWIGRFRFVTADGLALRFGVSVQQARVRLRRLKDNGVISLHRAHVGEAYAAVITSHGRAQLGEDRRVKEPRVDVHRSHELAIVELVAQMELGLGPDVEVFTERDCRRREAEEQGRYSVDVSDGHGATSRRWPDMVLLTHQGKIGIEIEFYPKSTARLRRILRGYLGSNLAEVRFLVASRALARRLRTLEARERAVMVDGAPDRLCRVVIGAWDGAPEEERSAIRAEAA
jgi:hypothetical protein